MRNKMGWADQVALLLLIFLLVTAILIWWEKVG